MPKSGRRAGFVNLSPSQVLVDGPALHPAWSLPPSLVSPVIFTSVSRSRKQALLTSVWKPWVVPTCPVSTVLSSPLLPVPGSALLYVWLMLLQTGVPPAGWLPRRLPTLGLRGPPVATSSDLCELPMSLEPKPNLCMGDGRPTHTSIVCKGAVLPTRSSSFFFTSLSPYPDLPKHPCSVAPAAPSSRAVQFTAGDELSFCLLIPCSLPSLMTEIFSSTLKGSRHEAPNGKKNRRKELLLCSLLGLCYVGTNFSFLQDYRLLVLRILKRWE